MPSGNLTDIAVKALKPPTNGQVTYWDDSLAGFGVRVSQGGTKTFTLVHGDDRRRVTIGRYPIISLSEARTTAKRILAERTLGKHTAPVVIFSDALTQFFTTHCDQVNRPSTARGTKSLLSRHFLPKLRTKRLDDISRHMVGDIIDKMATPASANHAFAAIRAFFRWTVRRGYLPHSPCEGMGLPSRPNLRDRVLTDEELVAVWRAAEKVGGAGGDIARLLILTGQRRNEISGLRIEYLDIGARTITLPATLCKNHRAHTFPYGADMAATIIGSPEGEGFLFPARGTNGGRPFSGWSKTKIALDKVIAGKDGETALDPWVLHDLRRTFATNLAMLGVAPHVVEKLLNHVSGTISGVAAIYNRFQYAECQFASNRDPLFASNNDPGWSGLSR